MKNAFIGFLLIFAAFPAFSQLGKDDKVWLNVEALHKAIFEEKDSAAIQNLVAENVTYGHSTGLLENKPVMLHNAVHSVESYKNLSLERLSTTYAGTTAIVRYILRGEVSKEGTASPLNIAIMQVWAKQKGKWMLFARQAVKVPPKS